MLKRFNVGKLSRVYDQPKAVDSTCALHEHEMSAV